MNKIIRDSYILFLFALLFQPQPSYGQRSDSKAYIDDLKAITDIMVYDVTSPVAAARYYAYSTLASYEVLALQENDNHSSFFDFFQRPLENPFPQNFKLENEVVAYRYALLCTARKLLPSGKKLESKIKSLRQELVKEEVLFLDQIIQTIVDYANRDGFLQLNNLKRYTPKRGPAFWQPTKPAYMAPVEPNWNSLTPLFLKSADQFLTKPPVKYDLNPESDFYKLLLEVKQVTDQNDKKKNEIAAFWDCNPYAISQIGHLEFGLKKISPGGHWMGIAGIATRKARFDVNKTIFTHTILALVLHDAFIACWDEKYRSNRVRPETVINRHLDKGWSPLLQTPPFPEYVSGHSVVSSASAEILTLIFGSNFSFRDTSEKEFGLKTRSYKSFKQAADEACISRLYGGIHYKDAIDEGIWQGRQVASFIIAKTKSHFPY